VLSTVVGFCGRALWDHWFRGRFSEQRSLGKRLFLWGHCFGAAFASGLVGKMTFETAPVDVFSGKAASEPAPVDPFSGSTASETVSEYTFSENTASKTASVDVLAWENSFWVCF